MHLYPHRRVAALPELDEAERSELPELYLALLRRMEAAYGAAMPYISAWHQAPVRRDRDLAHLHLEHRMHERLQRRLRLRLCHARLQSPERIHPTAAAVLEHVHGDHEHLLLHHDRDK